MGEVFKLNHCYNMDCLPAMELFPIIILIWRLWIRRISLVRNAEAFTDPKSAK